MPRLFLHEDGRLMAMRHPRHGVAINGKKECRHVLTRSIVRAHGGGIELGNGPERELWATVILPRG